MNGAGGSRPPVPSQELSKNLAGGTAKSPAIGTLTGRSVLLVGFKGTERAELAAEVQRRGGVVAHTCADATCAIVANESWAESVRARGVRVVQLGPAEDDPRTALECLADLIQADDEEFGPKAVDGEYRVRATVAGVLSLDDLHLEADGRILARLHEGQPCHRYITESEALEVLVAGGHRSERTEGGAR